MGYEEIRIDFFSSAMQFENVHRKIIYQNDSNMKCCTVKRSILYTEKRFLRFFDKHFGAALPP